ncbi:hypothetical protein ATL39_2993 [Sinobaca qinghaiensis]|uniref:Uncharacterized protein n=1 Tax=Sinobaca qinghaiensis TaxID=342944 RepID=A0A419UWQ9_9BACL|nr:hypothetical protein [Sinobaca qinghaiensis]RKD69573.1 hypothetical protein ATL39_2993 [Sinobaca qinghaiensis]
MNSKRVKKEHYLYPIVGGTATIVIYLIGSFIGVVELSQSSFWMLAGALVIVFPFLMVHFIDSTKRPNERKK